MGFPETFEGFMVASHESWSNFTKAELKRKPFGDHDLDIAIHACGVCGSDVHTLTGGWGKAKFPVRVGHEIVGRVVRAGSKVNTVHVGQRVGVGAQVGSCLDCKNCKSDNENYCAHGIPIPVLTRMGAWPTVGTEYFAFPIPQNIETSLTATLLCAGITSYSPSIALTLVRGKISVLLAFRHSGGLGHFGVLFAAAMGADVYAISHSPAKEDDALRLGAKAFICTKDDKWHEPYKNAFDFILNTTDATDRFDLSAYLSTLVVNGVFHLVGISDNPLPSLTTQDMMLGGYSIAASHIGSRREILAMLELASVKNIKSWVETIEISETGCKDAVQRVYHGKGRYRVTLVGYDKVFNTSE